MAVLNYKFAQLVFIDGVPDNARGWAIAAAFLEETPLTTDVLLLIGRQFREAPASVFHNHKVHAGIQIKDLETFLDALSAVHGNSVQLQCERIFVSHDLQNIYSAVLTQTPAASFLEDTMKLGIETEQESFLTDILNVSFVGG